MALYSLRIGAMAGPVLMIIHADGPVLRHRSAATRPRVRLCLISPARIKEGPGQGPGYQPGLIPDISLGGDPKMQAPLPRPSEGNPPPLQQPLLNAEPGPSPWTNNHIDSLILTARD